MGGLTMFSWTSWTLLLPFLLQTVVQNQNVEGFEWFKGVIISVDKVNETVMLLNELRLISSSDSRTVNQIMSMINEINLKIDYLGDFGRTNNPGKICSKNCDTSGFRENVEEIKSRYRQMKELAQNIDGSRQSSSNKKTFSEMNVSPGPNSVISIISNIFSTYLGNSVGELSNKAPLVNEIAAEFRDAEINNVCLSTSAQQYFFSDYWELSILGIQAYLINKFSWTILKNESFNILIIDEENFLHEHERRITMLYSKLVETIANAGVQIRTCDPIVWKEGVNYEQLTRLLQGYIVNEMNLNSDYSCSQDCRYYKNVNVSCYEGDQYCLRDRAEGNILSCEPFNGFSGVTVCPSKTRDRRYKYFETFSLTKPKKEFYGIHGNGRCPYTPNFAVGYTAGFVFCSYCFCLMDEKSDNSDRFFNLREVVSDTNENKVVTGVRFLKKNRIMYLQIQQGELAPGGLIKKNTLEWKYVEEYTLKEENNGIDYLTFDKNNRIINLDNIQILNSSYVVTGVKLHFDERNSHLLLKVRFSELDFQLGKLINPQMSEWIFDNIMKEDLIPLSGKSGGPKVSTLAPGKNVPSADIYDHIMFTSSNKKDDASQTTLPFFDTQNVASESPTPLSGVGLYHRGFNGYGGFIAPKIFTRTFPLI